MTRRRIVIGFWASTFVVLAGLTAAVLVAIRAPQPAKVKNTAQAGPQLGFVRVNRPAPAFELPKLSGAGQLGPGQLAGRPIVVNFWSSTCAPCQKETPAVAQVARATHGRVTFLGVDTLDTHASAVAFAARYHVPYDLVFDPQGTAGSKYGVPGLPETVFLSPSGTRIIGINVGALTVRSLTSDLKTLYGV